MARNICIFSDGTGQAGGANPIDWTNVYRLFMATREADPAGQICFYDPGLGSNPDSGEVRGLFRRLKDILAQATGYGITDNIIDCYAALLLAYEPGDCVFLFGFSRGAYTVRSLAGALGLCGIPSGLPKVRHWEGFAEAIAEPSLRKLAAQAVEGVYMVKGDAEAGARRGGFSTRARHGAGTAVLHRRLGYGAGAGPAGDRQHARSPQVSRPGPQPGRAAWPAGAGDRREP
jgi:hypothetical protein